MNIDGAAIFYTAPTQPQTYTLLRSYLLHRLYTTPPPVNPTSSTDQQPQSQQSTSHFPFPHRANVLDRDAVMVPSGWDSWGKINVLREGFDPNKIGKAWVVSLKRERLDDMEDDEEEGEGREEDAGGGEGLEEIWRVMIPNISRITKVSLTIFSIDSFVPIIHIIASIFNWMI